MRVGFKERVRERTIILWFKFSRLIYKLFPRRNWERIKNIDVFLLSWYREFELFANNKLAPKGNRVDLREIRVYDIIETSEVYRNKNLIKELVIRNSGEKDSDFIDEYEIVKNIEDICVGKIKDKKIGRILVNEKNSLIKEIDINFMDATLRYILVEYSVKLNRSGMDSFDDIIIKDKDDFKSKHLARCRLGSVFSPDGWHVLYEEVGKYKEEELHQFYKRIKLEVDKRFSLCYESLFTKLHMEKPAIVRLDTDIEIIEIYYKNFWNSIGINERNSFYQEDKKIMVNYGSNLKKIYTFHMISNMDKDGDDAGDESRLTYSDGEIKVIIKSIYLECLLHRVNESIQEISQDYTNIDNRRIRVDQKLLRFYIEKYKIGDVFEEFSIESEEMDKIKCNKLCERIRKNEREFDKRIKYYNQLQKRILEMINVKSISEQKKLNKTSRILTVTIICLSILALLGAIKYDVDRNYLEHIIDRLYMDIIKPIKNIILSR